VTRLAGIPRACWSPPPATNAATNVVGAWYFWNLYRSVPPLLHRDVCRTDRHRDRGTRVDKE